MGRRWVDRRAARLALRAWLCLAAAMYAGGFVVAARLAGGAWHWAHRYVAAAAVFGISLAGVCRFVAHQLETRAQIATPTTTTTGNQRRHTFAVPAKRPTGATASEVAALAPPASPEPAPTAVHTSAATQPVHP